MERHVAFLGAPCLAPFDVGTDVFGFTLCDATVDGDIKLCTGLVAVDLLLYGGDFRTDLSTINSFLTLVPSSTPHPVNINDKIIPNIKTVIFFLIIISPTFNHINDLLYQDQHMTGLLPLLCLLYTLHDLD